MTNGEVLARFPLREPSADPDQGVCQLPEEGLCKSYTLRVALRKVYNAVCIVMQCGQPNNR